MSWRRYFEKKRDYDNLEKRIYALEEGLESLAKKLGYKIVKGIQEWSDAEAVKVDKEDLKDD